MENEMASLRDEEPEERSAIKRFGRGFSMRFFRHQPAADSSRNVENRETAESCSEVCVASQATKLIEGGRALEAKRLILDTISKDGQTSFLLQRLAEIEKILGNNDLAVKWLVAALILTPDNFEAQCGLARALYRAGRYTEAREAIEKLTADQRRDPEVRGTLGAIYRAIGWYAHAVEAYGSILRLPWRSAYFRLASWLACGAPINIHHSDAWRFECAVDDNYIEESTRCRDFLASFNFPPTSEGRHIVDDLNTFLIRWLTIRMRLRILSTRKVARPGLIGCLGFAWLTAFVAFYEVEKPVWDLSSSIFAAIIFAEVAVFIIVGITKVVRESAIRGRSLINPQYFWFLVILAILELGVTGPVPLAFLWVLILDVAATSVIWMGSLYDYYSVQSSLVRNDLQWVLADAFLDLLFEVSKLGEGSRSHERAQWISRLSEMAWILESGNSQRFGVRDQAIREQINTRAQKAASFIRMIASSMAVSDKGAWGQAAADLKYGALAAVSGDIGSLAPRQGESRVEVKPRFSGPLLTILKVAIGLGVLAASIGILWWSKNRQDIGLAITAVVTAVATALTSLLLGSERRGSDIGSG